jgi:hypothetical protein
MRAPYSLLLGDELQIQPASPPHLLAIVAPHAAAQAMLALAARLALRGALRVLDGGNRFNAYHVARLLRSLKDEDPAAALARIQVARAFTCYQMTALLEQTLPQGAPTLVIDLLDTFYDESAPLPQRRRLAVRCADHLRRLGQRAWVVVSLRPPQPDPTGLSEIICAAADRALFLDEIAPPPPPRLFE